MADWTRRAGLDRLKAGERWDLIVVGGGATGLGTAVDAAARGYRTLLLEAHDFAKGTSSRSTKLIHGGVRYLAQGRIGLVREALGERARLLRNVPHLVRPLTFVVPAYSAWSRPYYGLGLTLYDLLSTGHGLGRTRWLSRATALELAPTLEPSRLRGGIAYTDGQFDDARLAIALARTAVDLGATALNYFPVIGMVKESGRVAGVRARDSESGEEFELRARAVVNAAGVFADEVRRLDDPSAAPSLRPSQGAHIVLPRRFLPGEAAMMVPKTDDGRVLFAIPWHAHAVVGTTDTPVARPDIEPRPLADEVDFLLEHAARYLAADPTPADILSLFAGLRPLIGGKAGRTSGLSREHAVTASPSGLVTVLGGKWTTYRRMASDAVDRASAVAGLPARPSPTADLPLRGHAPPAAENPWNVYGSDAPAVASLLSERPEWSALLHPDLPGRAGEVVWAARHESARTVEDILARRSRALFLDARSARSAAPRVADLLAEELGRDAAWRAAQVRAFEELASGYLPSNAKWTPP